MTTAAAVPVGAILTDLAHADPDAAAITCGGTTTTRGQLERWSNQLARCYSDLGVGQGDLVTISLPNGPELFAACFATWKLGAVPQPVSWRLPEPERRAIVELADSALVVGVGPGSFGARPCLPAGFEPSGSLQLLGEVPVPPSWKATTSGGSTGRPKLILSGVSGVMDPDNGLAIGMRRDGVQLVPGPLYHNAPFGYAMVGLYLGNHLVVMPRFDPAEALDAIERHRVDWAFFVPTMLHRMLRVIEARTEAPDLSSLAALWHSAAPCPVPLKRGWIELLGPERVWEIYGGTEAQALTVISGQEWLERPGSVGRPVFGEMRVLDPESGEQLPAGEVGEVFMRRPVGAPRTYTYVGAEVRERQGWESLGDMGSIDADGYLYLADRRTDMIVVGGANVYPAEVENALLQHPHVESCVVVGLPDDDLGQVPHAVIQTEHPLTLEGVRDFLSGHVSHEKLPRSVRLVEVPLRGDDGKVRRSAVREEEIALQHELRVGQPLGQGR